MKLFGKKKTEEQDLYERTSLEKKFEETGRKVGEKTGKVAQKGVDKYHDIVAGLEESGKLNKVRETTNKAAKKTDEFFAKTEEKISEVVEQVKRKKHDKDE